MTTAIAVGHPRKSNRLAQSIDGLGHAVTTAKGTQLRHTHTIRAGATTVKKGAPITGEIAARLAEEGVREIVAVRLEQGDVAENEAASRLAARLIGGNILAEAPFTGRVNMFATTAGVLQVDVAAIDGFNAVDEAITVATLPALKAVVAGELVATVKIIPYAVSEARVEQALAALGAEPAVAVAAYRPSKVGVISTTLPGLKPSVVDKTMPIHVSNVALVDANGKPSRVGIKVEDGKKVRFLKTTGAVVGA